jgi:hypothetical protein
MTPEASESHFLHLGATIIKVSSWIQRGIHRRSVTVRCSPPLLACAAQDTPKL